MNKMRVNEINKPSFLFLFHSVPRKDAKRRIIRELFVSKNDDKSGKKMMKKQKWSGFELKRYLFVQTWCALFDIKIMRKKAEKGIFRNQKGYEMTALASEKVENQR